MQHHLGEISLAKRQMKDFFLGVSTVPVNSFSGTVVTNIAY